MKHADTLFSALCSYVAEVLTTQVGPTVTASDIKRIFPELPRPSLSRPLHLPDQDALVDLDCDVLGLPDELPSRFWARFEMTMHPCVVVIHSSTRWHWVELSVLTNGPRDWWFTVPQSNIGGYGYEIDDPTRASTALRRDQVLDFVSNPDEWVSNPGSITTSLTRVDLTWLRDAQALPVRYRRGSLSRL